MKLRIEKECPDFTSYRAACVKSMFNAETGNRFSLEAELPIEEMDWQIGLVVGPSGSGKSSLGQEVLGPKAYHTGFDWPHDTPVIDAIEPDKDMNRATAALAAVGLGSVPSWLRPFHVLSTGEKFRAELARVVCEAPAQIVIDEFTSVVDRQIAKIGASAFARAWRKTKG
jgi:ABC-type Mn2+/Zn2+ transport system ATPase subunit